jgi:hypothetical protein
VVAVVVRVSFFPPLRLWPWAILTAILLHYCVFAPSFERAGRVYLP